MTLKIYLLCSSVLFRNSSKLLYFCCNVQIYMWIYNLIIRLIHTSRVFTFLAGSCLDSLELCRIKEVSQYRTIHRALISGGTRDHRSPEDQDGAFITRTVMSSYPLLVLKPRKIIYKWKSGSTLGLPACLKAAHCYFAFFFYFWRKINFISMALDALPIFRETATKGKQIHRLSLAVI